MADEEYIFDFEKEGNFLAPSVEEQVVPELPVGEIGQQPRNYVKNFRKTVCAFWVKGMCMKGDSCGFLHKWDMDKMPPCHTMMKKGSCPDKDCPFKHTMEDIKECNMYALGFCVFGPECRYKHTRQPGPPPAPYLVEAAKPKQFRDINRVVNMVNENVTGNDGPHAKRPRLMHQQQPVKALPAPLGPPPPGPRPPPTAPPPLPGASGPVPPARPPSVPPPAGAPGAGAPVGPAGGGAAPPPRPPAGPPPSTGPPRVPPAGPPPQGLNMPPPFHPPGPRPPPGPGPGIRPPVGGLPAPFHGAPSPHLPPPLAQMNGPLPSPLPSPFPRPGFAGHQVPFG